MKGKGHGLLSLYSTATQNPSHWGFGLGNTSNARILRWVYQNVGISKACGANANPKICFSPNANRQREEVEYRSRWACIFHFFCVDFICVGYPIQTRFLMEYGLSRGNLLPYRSEFLGYLAEISFIDHLSWLVSTRPIPILLTHTHLPHPPPHNHPHPNLIAPPPSSGKPQNHAIKINPVHNQVTSKDTPYLHGPGLPSPPGRGVPLRPPGRLPRPPTVSPTPWSESWDSLEVTGGEVTVLSRGSDRCYCQPLATPALLSVLCMRYGKAPARLVVATTPLALALSLPFLLHSPDAAAAAAVVGSEPAFGNHSVQEIPGGGAAVAVVALLA